MEGEGGGEGGEGGEGNSLPLPGVGLIPQMALDYQIVLYSAAER